MEYKITVSANKEGFPFRVYVNGEPVRHEFSINYVAQATSWLHIMIVYIESGSHVGKWCPPEYSDSPLLTEDIFYSVVRALDHSLNDLDYPMERMEDPKEHYKCT